ncbi:MAG TPA: DUF2877 domain-containing protein [Candidatus Limnocylindrales bacterium]|nr:DUF2877 domain-containing protein [Candidatus Limnocylindrales bacterium]
MSTEIERILDQSRRLSIHSVFDSAVNLRAGRRLVTCTTRVISVPNGIEMARSDLAGLQRLGFTTPRDVLEWRPADRVLASGTGAVAIAAEPDTVVFETAVPAASSDDLHGPARDLLEHLARTQARTGLGCDWPALTDDVALTSAVESLAAGRADEAVIHWLGRGPGLTPSGDDVLAGMITALLFAGAVDPSRIGPLGESIDAAASRLTTDLSAEYLHYACRRMASGMVRDLLVALDRSDAIAVQDALDRLGRHGDTSGIDCALGVVLALIVSPSRATRDR